MRFGGDQPEHVQRAQQARPALADRRQNAREAFWDGVKDDTARALDEAIDTAVRVRVTPEIIEAAELADDDGAAFVNVITAAFAAAGFMVEE